MQSTGGRIIFDARFSVVVGMRGHHPLGNNGCLGHHIARRRAVGIEAVLCQPFADDGAVSHHADQMVVLPDRNGAYIMLTHQFREVGDRGVRTDLSPGRLMMRQTACAWRFLAAMIGRRHLGGSPHVRH